MNEYEKQAKDFLASTSAELSVTYLRTGPMDWDADGQGRDIYSFTISRNNRIYTSEFGQSLNNSGHFHFCGDPQRGIAQERSGRKEISTWLREGQSNDYNCWDKNREFSAPSAYDVLACLEPSVCCDNVDDFAYEFGYEKPSDALRAFEAVKAQSAALMTLFDDAECMRLAEIC